MIVAMALSTRRGRRRNKPLTSLANEYRHPSPSRAEYLLYTTDSASEHQGQGHRKVSSSDEEVDGNARREELTQRRQQAKDEAYFGNAFVHYQRVKDVCFPCDFFIIH